MRWMEIVETTSSFLSQANSVVMDMLMPLKAQGISSVHMDQVIDQLKQNLDTQGLIIDSQLVMKALEPNKDISIEADPNELSKMVIHFGDDLKTRQVGNSKAKQEKDHIDKKAMTTIKKDLKDAN